MARYRPTKEEPVAFHITRNAMILIFIGLLVVVAVAFMVGLMIGRGQRATQEELAQLPPVVVEAPQPKPPPPPEQEPEPVVPKPSAPPPPQTQEPSTPPVTPPATSPQQEAPTEQYVVQVFATRSRDKARQTVAGLQRRGFPAYQEVAPNGMFRVRVGPYTSKELAQRALQQIQKIYPKETPIVVPLS